MRCRFSAASTSTEPQAVRRYASLSVLRLALATNWPGRRLAECIRDIPNSCVRLNGIEYVNDMDQTMAPRGEDTEMGRPELAFLHNSCPGLAAVPQPPATTARSRSWATVRTAPSGEGLQTIVCRPIV